MGETNSNNHVGRCCWLSAAEPHESPSIAEPQKPPPLFSTPEKNVKKDLRNRTVALIVATEWFHKPKHET